MKSILFCLLGTSLAAAAEGPDAITNVAAIYFQSTKAASIETASVDSHLTINRSGKANLNLHLAAGLGGKVSRAATGIHKLPPCFLLRMGEARVDFVNSLHVLCPVLSNVPDCSFMSRKARDEICGSTSSL